MLTLYRRHLKCCGQSSAFYRRCKCPIWVRGTLERKRIRKSLDLVNWERAVQLIREWEELPAPRVTVEQACDRCADDAVARHLGISSQEKYRLLFRELKEYFRDRDVKGITVDDIAGFRETWKLSPVSARKKLERLRTFFGFCKERGWIETNPAKAVKLPKASVRPTLPYTEEEYEQIIFACELQKNPARMKALIELMRYSGLRLSDACTIRRDAIDEDARVFLYTQKTGQPVFVPIPSRVAKQLREVENKNPAYVFWSGRGSKDSSANDWHKILKKLFNDSGVRKAHSHRLRDSFAVSLLLGGASIEEVAVLLGHSNSSVTMKHYAPWIGERQRILEEKVRRTWKDS